MYGIYLSELSADEINELIIDAGFVGAFIGVLIGVIVFAVFYLLLQQTYRKNFKMWFLQLNEAERRNISENLNTAYDVMDELSKSNTRLFKTMYNDLMRLKSYLSQKWMQN